MTAALARTETLLTIEKVSLSYGSTVVLRDVKATIQDLIRPGCITGQVCGLLAPSGFGKSTLLRIIAGLQKPTAGNVRIGESLIPVKVGDVGMVSQKSTLYRHHTVLKNLMIAARFQKYPKPAAMDMLASFGLEAIAGLYPVQLSGGQQQRVAIAQQMLCGSDFLCFDEPTSGLDPLAKATTCDLISKLANRSEIETLLICSHDVPSVVAICDSIWLLGRQPGGPGATIVETIDLIARGLAFQPDVYHLPAFTDTVRELQERFRTL